MANNSSEISLFCLLSGIDSAIKVTVAKNSHVSDLKLLFLRRVSNTLPGVDDHALSFWMLNNPIPLEEEREFVNIAPKDIAQIAVELKGTRHISTYFPSQPAIEYLHIVVIAPQNARKRKRALSPSPSPSLEDETAHRLKRLALLPRMAASTLAEYLRPGGVPVTLLHPVFGQFVDDASNTTLTSEDYEFAWVLRKEMSGYFPWGSERAEVFRELLWDSIDIPLEDTSSRGTDGHYHVKGYCVVETEAHGEIGGRGVEPYLLNGIRYAHFVRTLGDQIGGVLGLLWRVTEMHYSTFTGPFIGFVGAAFTDVVRQDMLTAVHSFIWEPHDELSATQVARVLRAFRNAVECLKQYYTQELPTIQELDPSEWPNTRYPYPSKYRPISASGDAAYVKFSYTDVIENKLIFKGRTVGKDEIIIKFTRRYSKEVHLWCAEHGYAPNLRGFEQLPGGWLMIVMDVVDASYTGLYLAQAILRHGQAQCVRNKVEELVRSLHTAGYVHGDLRGTNLLVAPQENGDVDVKLVDYDWAGIAGEVQYPPLINRESVHRAAGAVSGNAIVKEHDVDMVTFMFQDHLLQG
ncbi:hypothetical protein BKA93DRAFT_823843 [Sparassis latifolia]